MRNITVSVEDGVYRQARIRAAEQGVSVSALVAGYLRGLSARGAEFDRLERQQADVLASIESFRASDRFPRDEVHTRAVR